MDRKAWIVIILCLIGMGANIYIGSQNAAEAARIAAEQAAAQPPPAADETVTDAGAAAASDVKTGTDTSTEAAKDTPAPAQSAPEKTASLTRGSVTYEFSTLGGGIKTATLAQHDSVVLNQYARSRNRHEPIGAIRREPGAADTTTYELTAQTDSSITFTGTTKDGLIIEKTYEMPAADADEHLVTLHLQIRNPGAQPFQTQEMFLYTGTAASLRPDELLKPGFFWNDAGDADHKDASFFKGGWFSSAKPEYRASFNDLRYGGVMSRFFATIVSREAKEDSSGQIWASSFAVDHTDDEFRDLKAAQTDMAVEAAIGLPPLDIPAGGEMSTTYQIYTGPKEYQRLRDLGGQRQFVMFYGWFTVVSKVLINTLTWLHGLAGNWGVAIILMTLIIRLVIWPLQAKSQYSMKRMGLLGPKMKELQEKYKEDPQKQQAEMMKLYRDYGVNPVGGCLPMLLQFPIFLGFYRVLQNAAELRGQHFLWVQDLSLPDTIAQINGFNVNPLPLLMGVSMFLQMKLTPQPATVDKTQQRIFMLMPFMFLFFCYSFASALALYWTTQNIFSIFQTWVMKLYMPEPTLEKVERKAAAKAASAPSMFQMGGQKKPKDSKKNRPPRLGG
ncbi:MAG: membrane protein insertase YidC [Verrucomicrobiales bacterium]|nr:membrane protein insertase YidC [Verrucomicrobiales bacterium]